MYIEFYSQELTFFRRCSIIVLKEQKGTKGNLLKEK